MGILYTWRTLPSRTRHSLTIAFLFTLYLFYVILRGRNDHFKTISSQSSRGIEYSLAFREKKPLNFTLTVVLLHSDALDSSVWEDIQTMDILYKEGYRVLALDLPGHGNSKSKTAPNEMYERAIILNTVLKQLEATESILVAPSMSGTYALPVVIRGSLNLKGFVPISPYGYEQFQKGEYSLLKIPTLILYGIGDMKYGDSSVNLLQLIPDSKVYRIKDASHACYLQNPVEFHEVLVSFLKDIEHGTFHAIREEQNMKRDMYR